MSREQPPFLVLLGVVCLAISLLPACSAETRHKIISAVFDGADSPRPPTRMVRRDLLHEIEDLKQQLAEAKQVLADAREGGKTGKGIEPSEKNQLSILQAKRWDDVAQLLPKDKAGQVDWEQALKAGVIAPRSSFDPKAPDQAVLELDIELTSSANKLFGVTFSHSAHTRWLTCNNCHPAIFPLRQAKPTIVTMAKIQAGEYCGACHGRVAFSTGKDCSRCHKKQFSTAPEWIPPEPRKPIESAKSWGDAAKALPVTEGMTDWVKALSQGVIAPRAGIDPKSQDEAVLPLDVELVPAAGEMFKAIFSHKTHTELLSCPNCHTGIFQMAKGADAITMEKINAGQFCGACHGKVAFSAAACGRCHAAMAGGK